MPMFQIDKTLVSLDVVESQFVCDLSCCKGACCIEGDSGAPLKKNEIAELEKAFLTPIESADFIALKRLSIGFTTSFSDTS